MARRTQTDDLVAERLRRRRLVVGLSRRALGEGVGLSWQAIQKYESGENRITAGRLAALAEVLGVKPAWFFAEDDATRSVVVGGRRATRSVVADPHRAEE